MNKYNYMHPDPLWRQLKLLSPLPPRSYFATCLSNGVLYVHGGYHPQDGILKDMYSACLTDSPMRWVQRPIKNGPGPLRNHTLVSYMNSLVLVGGQQTVISNNSAIYRYNTTRNEWTHCHCQGKAPALDSHSAVLVQQHIYVLFGYDSHTAEHNQSVYRIHLAKLTQDIVEIETITHSHAPVCRSNASACAVNDEIYVFGGGSMEGTLADLWVLNKGKWEEIRTKSKPESRKGHTLVAYEGCLFLFGGIHKITKEQNDIHMHAVSSGKWVKVHSTPTHSPTTRPSSLPAKAKAPRTTMSTTNHKTPYTTNDFLTTIKPKMSVMREKRYRAFIHRKKKLLSSINCNRPPTHLLRNHSPTSQALMFSLASLGEQQPQQLKPMGVTYDAEKGEVIGRKPCGRDGHGAVVYEGRLFVVGGDRHRMAFSDAFVFDLKIAMENIDKYDI